MEMKITYSWIFNYKISATLKCIYLYSRLYDKKITAYYNEVITLDRDCFESSVSCFIAGVIYYNTQSYLIKSSLKV